MAKNSAPVMRLIGGVRLKDSDWDLASYRDLFAKFNAIARPGVVTRLIRYYGEIQGRTALRFFGVETLLSGGRISILSICSSSCRVDVHILFHHLFFRRRS